MISSVLNSIYVGTKPWLKIPLMVDLIIVCAVLSAALGHNIALIIVFPLVVSARYFDQKYTLYVAILTAILFAVAIHIIMSRTTFGSWSPGPNTMFAALRSAAKSRFGWAKISSGR